MNRRVALQGLAGLAAAAGGRPAFEHLSGAASMATEASVTVLLDEPIGTIRPSLYGQFTEHIGGVIYDGIWVGTDSKVPNIGGIRKDLVEHVRQLGKVVDPLAGGCFADRYHWRDLVGPLAHPVLYLRDGTCNAAPKCISEGEPAITKFVWPFTLIHSSSPPFSLMCVWPSTGSYPRFSLAMDRSLGFGSTACDSNALFRLAFASAPRHRLTLPHTVTRRLILQKARHRGHPKVTTL